jgi:diguanylate cyclase (GGDEF)-like protein
MESKQPFSQASVVKNTAAVLALIIVLGLGMRAVIAGVIDPIATSMGLVCAGLLYTVYRKVRQGAPAASGAIAVMGVALLIYAALAWTSHGFRGSVIFAAPMLPLVASLMLGRRGTRNVTVITAIILLFILTQHLSGNLNPDESFPEEIRYVMRAIIMLLSLVGVAWITSYFSIMVAATSKPALEDETRDPLTGLLIRQVLEQNIEREFARARRAESSICLAIIEMDKSLELQAEYGPRGAENCLLGVAEGLAYGMRRSSDTLARYDNWQLAILLSDTNCAGGRRVAEKIRQLIEKLDIPVSGELTTRVTVSVGLASVQGRSTVSRQQWQAAAETAVQGASLDGGNRTEVLDLDVSELEEGA